jgi:predicted transcriptional regulator YdeE
MQPKLISVQPFIVSGLSVRTVNRDEADPSKARLPALWERFYRQNLMDNIPNKLANSFVYGVYSDYESDASGEYTVTAGVAVSTPTSKYASAQVGGGHYLVFELSGAIPQVVIEGWSSVWQYFAQPQKHKRAFATDFEEYRGPEHVAIFISVTDENA